LSCCLLDVNILIALQWPGDAAHRRIQEWFLENGTFDFSTCSITQSGFIRVITNPSFSGSRVHVSEARDSLVYLTKLEGHRFWPMDVGFSETTAPFADKIVGYRQVTDAYLLGLAIQRDGILVSQDRAMAHLAGSRFSRHVKLL
jgi:uncharacterized protein